MYTFEHLTVTFESSEASDAEVFARLFDHHIQNYERLSARRDDAAHQLAAEQSDDPGGHW